jgi:integrase
LRLVVRWGLTLEDFDSPNLKQTFSAHFPSGWKPSTCTAYITRVCCFGNWLARSHYTNQRHHLPAAYRRMKNRPVPTDAEVERLIEHLRARASAASGWQRTRQQDLLIVRVLYETGARITEALSLNVDDVRAHGEGFYIIINGTKSESAHRAVPISCELAADLKAFRLHWGIARGRLFRSKSGRPLIGSVWGRVLKSYCVQLGIHCIVTPHVFRYAYILREIAKGTSALELMTRLGHSDITMTVYYFNQVRRLMPFIEFNADIALLEKKLQTRRHIWSDR